MTLNKKQKIILFLGVITIVLMGLFPPWLHTYNTIVRSPVFGSLLTGSQDIVGYHFLFAPPAIEKGSANAIDISRLFVQWTIVFVLTVGFIIIYNKD